MTTTIRYVHAGNLTTDEAHALVWNVGEIGERYQEIAIANDRVIGSWTYGIEWNRGKATIASAFTDVQQRYRRKGVARALWFAGIKRWTPVRINSTIGTDEGRDFLAHMIAELTYRNSGIFLSVATRQEDREGWQERCGWAARHFLRDLGKRERAAKRIAAPTMKLLKGAAA